jgi:hypothetical protein
MAAAGAARADEAEEPTVIRNNHFLVGTTDSLGL